MNRPEYVLLAQFGVGVDIGPGHSEDLVVVGGPADILSCADESQHRRALAGSVLLRPAAVVIVLLSLDLGKGGVPAPNRL